MKLIRGMICLLLTTLLLFLFFLWLPEIWGFEMYVVSSGSMEPELKAGDVIFVKPVSFTELQTGDIITYTINGGTMRVTHRIAQIDGERGMIQTKGDANAEADASWIRQEAVLGRVEFHVPHLGGAVYVASTLSGKLFVLAVSLWLIALWMLTDRLILKKDRREMSSY